MKKLLLSAVLGLAITGTVSAQGTACTPNPANTIPGIYPGDSLPTGYIGAYYDEVIDFVMPLDTTVNIPPFGPTQAYFCTFKLVGSANLPTGMSFYCSGNLDPTDASNQTWKVDHTPGVINRGCVRLQGYPGGNLSADMDSLALQIYIAASFTAPSAGNNYGCTPVAGIPATLTTQNYKILWRIKGGVGVETATAQSIKFTVAPNPSNTEANISLDMPVNENLKLTLCDIMGREVRTIFNENTHQGAQNFSVNTGDLTAGVYFVKATLGNTKVFTQKLMVNH